ncbi:MAG: N-formylglutamate amidohydrolase [Candidatus Aenigmarchaeota archaeon]|nr:N-formylglutamate amidohydrolase [Candidatus Aenigmarchaeota archaeon]
MSDEYEQHIDFGHHKVTDSHFVEIWESTKPNRIIVTVPHDGTPNYKWPDKLRRMGVRGGDPGVWLIAMDMMFEHPKRKRYSIQDSISVVRGTIPRGQVDFNRSWPIEKSYYKYQRSQSALENPRYISVYNHFHNNVARLIERGIDTYGRSECLLIDLHGFSEQPDYAPKCGYDLILGTGNRQTIFYHDVDMLMGSFFSRLDYTVFVPEDKPGKGHREDRYNADFITRGYAERYQVNAIQLETAHKFRDRKGGALIGPKLSRDLVRFFGQYFNGK